MDNFDLANGGTLQEVFEGIVAKILVLSFKSDWLYPAYQSREIVSALKLVGGDVTYCEVDSTYGHDAFLLEIDEETHLVGHFLKKIFQEVPWH
jgi:homoserine O-acetyltransferase